VFDEARGDEAHPPYGEGRDRHQRAGRADEDGEEIGVVLDRGTGGEDLGFVTHFRRYHNPKG